MKTKRELLIDNATTAITISHAFHWLVDVKQVVAPDGAADYPFYIREGVDLPTEPVEGINALALLQAGFVLRDSREVDLIPGPVQGYCWRDGAIWYCRDQSANGRPDRWSFSVQPVSSAVLSDPMVVVGHLDESVA